MSVTRKIIDSAREGLNSLMDRAQADETPLSGIDGEKLDAELERRQAARKAGGAAARAPRDNPRARWAGAGDEATGHRKAAAQAREKRIHQGRAEQSRADQAARDEAFRRFQEQARREAASGGGGASGGAGAHGPAGSGRSGSSGGPRAGSRRPGGFNLRRDEKIARYYKVLDLPYGADFDQVKAAYRKLMRKYHPDLHGESPQKQKAATELTMQVTQAYNELEAYLKKA